MDDAERIERNRRLWAQVNAEVTDRDAAARWASDQLVWGLTATPEASLGVLGELEGRDVLDLGCGTGYFSAWLARRGATVTAVDLSPEQLATARRCQDQFDVRFALVEANAEVLPLPDASFDVVVSEHGVGVWCRPDAWVAEAARVLRPGGRLVFLVNSVLSALTVPDEKAVLDATRLARSIKPQIYIVAKTHHTSAGMQASQLGANEVLKSEQVVARQFYELLLRKVSAAQPNNPK